MLESTINNSRGFIFTETEIRQIWRRQFFHICLKSIQPKTNLTSINLLKISPFFSILKILLLLRMFCLSISVMDLSSSKTMVCSKKLQSFLLFSFFQFCDLPFPIRLQYLTLAKVPFLSLLLNSLCLIISFYCHLASQLRKFCVKCHYCFVSDIAKKGKSALKNPLQVSLKGKG